MNAREGVPVMRPGGAPAQGNQRLGISLQQNDRLPPEALKDPLAQSGMGSAYATNQPQLAEKYGVIRDGVHIPPQQLRNSGGVRQLSPETIRDLQALAGVQEAQRAKQVAATEEQVPAPPPAREQAPTISPADQPPAKKDEAAELVGILKDMDDFDFGRLLEMSRKDSINNSAQRAIIEARLTPLGVNDLTELLMTGRVRQKVPIIPGVFEVTFESLATDADLEIKRMLVAEAKTLDLTDRYIQDKMSVYTVTVGVYAINSQVLPSHTVMDTFDAEAFNNKFKFLRKYPIHMLSSLVANYAWFDTRVRNLFVTENIKNG